MIRFATYFTFGMSALAVLVVLTPIEVQQVVDEVATVVTTQPQTVVMYLAHAGVVERVDPENPSVRQVAVPSVFLANNDREVDNAHTIYIEDSECIVASQHGRITVSFDGQTEPLNPNGTSLEAISPLHTTHIPPGKYHVHLVSEVPDEQAAGSWFATLHNSDSTLVTRTPKVDTGENSNVVSVGDISVLEYVDSVRAVHADYFLDAYRPVRPVCAVFDKFADNVESVAQQENDMQDSTSTEQVAAVAAVDDVPMSQLWVALTLLSTMFIALSTMIWSGITESVSTSNVE